MLQGTMGWKEFLKCKFMGTKGDCDGGFCFNKEGYNYGKKQTIEKELLWEKQCSEERML